MIDLDKWKKKLVKNGLYFNEYQMAVELMELENIADINKLKYLSKKDQEIVDAFELIVEITNLFGTELYLKEETCEKYTEIFLLSQLIFKLSNDLLAILMLSISGLNYQCRTLCKSTMELCLLLCYLINNPEKIEIYMDSTSTTKIKENWKKYFTFAKLKENFINILSKQVNVDLKATITSKYNYFCDCEHNSLLSIFVLNFSGMDNGHLNVWGDYKNLNFNNLIDIMDVYFATSLVFTDAFVLRYKDCLKKSCLFELGYFNGGMALNEIFKDCYLCIKNKQCFKNKSENNNC